MGNDENGAKRPLNAFSPADVTFRPQSNMYGVGPVLLYALHAVKPQPELSRKAAPVARSEDELGFPVQPKLRIYRVRQRLRLCSGSNSAVVEACMARCRQGPCWIAAPGSPLLLLRESIFQPKPPPER